MKPRRLCRLDDIADPGSRGFRFGGGLEERRIFVVRRAGVVAGYLNHCPHTGSPLDWVADRFLDVSRNLILCGTHGALFRIADGYCIAGPCAGKSLKPVQIEVCEETIYLSEDLTGAGP